MELSASADAWKMVKVDLKLFGFLLEQFVASEIGSVLKTAKKQSTMCSHLDFLWWLTHSLITTMTQVNTLCILVMFLCETYVSVYVSKKKKKKKTFVIPDGCEHIAICYFDIK